LGIARNRVTLDQAENLVADAAGSVDHSSPEIRPEHGLDFVGIVFEARYHLPAGSAGGAPADSVRFDNPDTGTSQRQSQRSGTAGKPCADYNHIG
jgi:hypothetical protein